jgi:four helix bundle protein
MAKVKRFEELIAWQKAREVTNTIYRSTAAGGFERDWALRDQMRRASVSMMSNIAEGFERGSAKDFSRFLSMAKASCAELRSQLYVAMDVGYIEKSEADRLQEQASETARIIGGLLASVRRQH